MTSARDDLIELSSYTWQRFRGRMDGLTDAEYFWEPVPNCRTVRRTPDGTYRSDGSAQPACSPRSHGGCATSSTCSPRPKRAG